MKKVARAVTIMAALIALATAPAAAETLSADNLAMLTLKVLTFDRNLADRSGGEVVIGVAYAAGEKSHADEIEASFKKFADKKVSGLSFRVVAVEYSDAAALDSWIKENKVSALYLSPGLVGSSGEIHTTASANKCLTIGADERFPRSGAGMGFGVEAGKQVIIIKLDRVKAEGVDFSSNLLSLAKII